ncbi:unnamed protein product [Adineta steineri]|uniref:C2 NT-type domain-containing protein n=2 Tax=Adineta steineri TaxID=433720 RepID=A0A814XR46_9BILA|nr:unnamed protein product [Adineta steineri]
MNEKKVKKSDSFVMMSPKTNNLDQIEMNKSHEILNGKGTTGGLLSTFNRKRRHTFDVDLKVERVLSLPYANGKFFFKIRLLNGGNHIYTCHERFEVHENKVEFNINDHFTVRMTSRVDNFTLDHCLCRISIRKEGRGGRSYEKIGFYDLDLASVAGSGDESKACLLNGYQQTNSSPANAYLEISMKITILEGDHIFRRPDNDHPYIKVEQALSNKKTHDQCTDECSSTMSTSAGELYPPSTTNSNRGHSRQASKSSVCSNYSTNSVNSTNNSISHEKNHLRQGSDEESYQQSQRRVNHKRRTPFIDQFGDIQRRLHSTRIDATEIVNSVMNNNAKTVGNSNGYLCLLYDEDGTAHVGSSSSCQSLQSTPASLFVST